MGKLKRRTEPTRTVHPAEYEGSPTVERVSCPNCDKLGTNVVTVSDTGDRSRCQRMAYCDHCDHIYTWLHPCDAVTGEPVGTHPLGEPTLITGRDRVAWLLKHFPQLKGVTHE